MTHLFLDNWVSHRPKGKAALEAFVREIVFCWSCAVERLERGTDAIERALLPKWVRVQEADPVRALPGHRAMTPKELEIDRL